MCIRDRLSIINAYENDRDITSIIKSRRAYLTLYLDNGELCLANVHPLHNSQSWGKLIVEDYERARTNDGSIDKISYAKWYYQNSYDNKTGEILEHKYPINRLCNDSIIEHI